jgi:hypothetical protein
VAGGAAGSVVAGGAAGVDTSSGLQAHNAGRAPIINTNKAKINILFIIPFSFLASCCISIKTLVLGHCTSFLFFIISIGIMS